MSSNLTSSYTTLLLDWYPDITKQNKTVKKTRKSIKYAFKTLRHSFAILRFHFLLSIVLYLIFYASKISLIRIQWHVINGVVKEHASADMNEHKRKILPFMRFILNISFASPSLLLSWLMPSLAFLLKIPSTPIEETLKMAHKQKKKIPVISSIW